MARRRKSTRAAAERQQLNATRLVANNVTFLRIHVAARCCRWSCFVSGQACLGTGAVLGVMGSQDGPQTRERPKTPQGCAAACSQRSRCTYFSHAAGLNACMLCSACDLDATTRGRWNGVRFTSWARVPEGASLAQYSSTSASQTVSGVLGPLLQAQYSSRLYGAPGRVDLHSLRIVWLAMLPHAALRAIGEVGVCRAEAKPPLQPFLTTIDLNANPRDAMWVDQHWSGEVADGGAGPHGGRNLGWLLQSQPAANNSWVEVTHCPRPAVPGAPRWKQCPMWLYAASGSGVSINLGRTLAVRSYWEASELLAAAFFGNISAECTSGAHVATAPLPFDSVQILHHQVSRHRLLPPSVRAATDRELSTCAHARAFSCAPLAAPPSPCVERGRARRPMGYARQPDSTQEFFSRDRRHEIVMLKWHEADALGPQQADLMCGRQPHLFRCASDSPALMAMRQCVRFNQRPFTADVEHELPMLSRFHPKSRCSHSPCYGTVGSSAQLCPDWRAKH